MELKYKVTENNNEKFIDFTVTFETFYIEEPTYQTIQKEAESLLASRPINNYASREISVFGKNKRTIVIFKRHESYIY